MSRRIAQRVVLAAVAITAWAEPQAAEAKCAAPQPVLSPETGSRLPPNPTLYAFWPHLAGDKPPQLTARDAKGRSVGLTQSQIAETEAFVVYQLKLATSAAGTVTLKIPKETYSFWRVDSWQFTIDPGWRAPVPPPARSGLSVNTQSSRWTCSYQLSQNLTLPVAAAAFQVTIADSREDYAAGRLRHLVLPPQMAMFFGVSTSRDGHDAGHPRSELQLGHSNCLGSTWTWTDKPIYVGLSALQPDGSAAPIGTAPVRVDPPATAPGAANREE